MLLQEFEKLCGSGESIEFKLPSRKLIVDPRGNYPNYCKFKCLYHDDGTDITVTLNRTDVPKNHGCDVGHPFSVRIFDPNNELVPDFDSKKYTYLGIDGECVPAQTIVGIIDTSVTIIKRSAFAGCIMMRRCIFHDKVEIIEKEAFYGCVALDALFLPSSSIKNIEDRAFAVCCNMKILPIPQDEDNEEVQISDRVLHWYHAFFRPANIESGDETNLLSDSNDRVNRAIASLYHDLPPLYRKCLEINVSTQGIHECIDLHGIPSVAPNTEDYGGMTPLHILALNPHASPGSILTCVEPRMSDVFVKDSWGMTPLDYLIDCNLDFHSMLVTALCTSRESKEEKIHSDSLKT